MNIRTFFNSVTDDRARTVDSISRAIHVDPEVLDASPYALIGSTGEDRRGPPSPPRDVRVQLCHRRRRRDRYVRAGRRRTRGDVGERPWRSADPTWCSGVPAWSPASMPPPASRWNGRSGRLPPAMPIAPIELARTVGASVFVRRCPRRAARRHRHRRHASGGPRRRRDPVARRRVPRRRGGADRLHARRRRPIDRCGAACRPIRALLRTPRCLTRRRRAARRRRRHRCADASVRPCDPGASHMALRIGIRLGRWRLVRPRCSSDRGDIAHRRRGRSRTTRAAHRRRHRCVDRAGARDGPVALCVRSRRHHRGRLAARSNTRLGRPGLECRRGASRRLYPRPSLEHNGEAVGSSSRPLGPSLVDDYGYAPQLKRFWTNIRTGRPVPATSQLGRQVLDVISAAHWSAGRNAIEVPLPFAGPRDRTPRELLHSRALRFIVE